METLINISHPSVGDLTLNAMESEELVRGPKGVHHLLDQLAPFAPSATPHSVDLIAHARGGVLCLGNWDIKRDPEEMTSFVEACDPSLRLLNVTKLRLLGCGTALTQRGQNAIRGLARAFHSHDLTITVFGTTVPIYAADFGQDGLSTTFEGLADRESLPILPADDDDDAWAAQRDAWFLRFEPISDERRPDFLSGLARESLPATFAERARRSPGSRWEIRQVKDASAGDLSPIRELLRPIACRAPRLLADPDDELVIPALEAGDDQAPMFHRFTVLLGGRFVRIYPDGDPQGLLLPVESRRRLEELVRRAEAL